MRRSCKKCRIPRERDNMVKIKKVITSISGRRGKDGYTELSFAVYEATKHISKEVPLKNIFTEMRQDRCTYKTVKSLDRSIARVTVDIWEFGDRKNLNIIFGKTLNEKPNPRELIYAIARYCTKISGKEEEENDENIF